MLSARPLTLRSPEPFRSSVALPGLQCADRQGRPNRSRLAAKAAARAVSTVTLPEPVSATAQRGHAHVHHDPLVAAEPAAPVEPVIGARADDELAVLHRHDDPAERLGRSGSPHGGGTADMDRHVERAGRAHLIEAADREARSAPEAGAASEKKMARKVRGRI